MKTKQEVKLLYISPLWLISNAIRYSHANFKINEGIDNFTDKDFDLIKRVGFKFKHESVLEFSQIVYHVKLSQKALLEATRHRIGVSWCVTSSRYALKKIDIELEPTGDEIVDDELFLFKRTIEQTIYENYSLDIVSKMLPQSFLYTAQVQFNLRSLLHFLRLRLDKSAHRDIRIIAIKMVEVLPCDYKELVLEDEKIEEKYLKTRSWFYGDNND